MLSRIIIILRRSVLATVNLLLKRTLGGGTGTPPLLTQSSKCSDNSACLVAEAVRNSFLQEVRLEWRSQMAGRILVKVKTNRGRPPQVGADLSKL